MNYCDLTIDRIHQLIDQSQELINQGMDYEASILITEAEDHARELRSEFIIV
jgi:hypothetical protein